MKGKPAKEAEDSETITTTRRGALRMGAAGAVAIGTLGASTMTAAADSVNFGAGIVQDPWIDGEQVVESHGSDMAQLEYVNDSGEVVSLRDDGFVLQQRSIADGNPNNPVTLRADKINADEFRAFPRGERYDSDSDGEDDADVSALDATHWTTTNATNGSVSVSDSGENGDALTISSSSVASGETVTATFSDFSITEGMARKFFQVVVDVDTLTSGSLLEFNVTDSNGNVVTASIDPAGDTSTTSVLANATGTALVRQVQLGEIGADGTLSDIDSIEVAISEADVGITLHGFNLERESEWKLGDFETTDSDGNIVTETRTEPSGTFSITDLETLGTPFQGAPIRDVTYAVEQRASELAGSQTLTRTEQTDRLDYPVILEVAHVFESPTAYDLSTTLNTLRDQVNMGSSRYLDVKIETAASGVESWDDVDNLLDSMTSRSDRYGSIDEKIDLSSAVSASDQVVVYFELNLKEDEASTYTKASSGGAVAAGGGGGGWLRSAFAGVALAITGYFAWIKKIAP